MSLHRKKRKKEKDQAVSGQKVSREGRGGKGGKESFSFRLLFFLSSGRDVCWRCLKRTLVVPRKRERKDGQEKNRNTGTKKREIAGWKAVSPSPLGNVKVADS